VRVIVVDGTLVVAEAAYRALPPAGIKTSFAGSLQELAVVLEAEGTPDLLVVNVCEEISGWEVIAWLQRAAWRGRVLAFVDTLTESTIRHLARCPGVECTVRPATAGALEAALRNVIPKPAGTEAGQSAPASPPPAAYHGIIGRSPDMLDIFARIEKVAAGDANVCIHGESGTGKELIARAIHYASPRRDRPLITLDCTTIPDGLMESHLLGHVRGAFTGAVEQREGVFSLAHTGTLFIDELAELSPQLQAKLLRVIQSREFTRVGGSKPTKADVRIITATNKDLKAEVDRGRFREDLYYRVAVFMIEVPPLRDRPEDVTLLVEHFLRKFSSAYGKVLRGVQPSAMQRLLAMPWPGNVRQLENFLEQAVVLADGDILTERDLFGGERASSASASTGGHFEPGLPLHEVERRHILRTLQKAHGNRTEAAKLLEISVRCLQYKLKAYAEEARTAADLS
jgi:DNA-binding NtrC family response regulator